MQQKGLNLLKNLLDKLFRYLIIKRMINRFYRLSEVLSVCINIPHNNIEYV